MCHYSNPAWSATVIKLQRERPSVPTGPFVVSRMAGVDQPKSPGQIVAGWAFSKVPVIGDLAKDLYHNVNEWRRYRAAQTGQQIAEIVGVEEMYELARENEELAALLVQVLEAAERSGYEAKRRLLVLAAANAFKNDEEINMAGIIVTALSQLDTVHIRALARLVALSDSRGPRPENYHANGDVAARIRRTDDASGPRPADPRSRHVGQHWCCLTAERGVRRGHLPSRRK